MTIVTKKLADPRRIPRRVRGAAPWVVAGLALALTACGGGGGPNASEIETASWEDRGNYYQGVSNVDCAQVSGDYFDCRFEASGETAGLPISNGPRRGCYYRGDSGWEKVRDNLCR